MRSEVGDHFGESTTSTIRRVRQAKVFEDLQESLLLIKESKMFPRAIGVTKEALADNGQSPIA
jgi:hypothetical protein